MRTALIVERLSNYRSLAPIVDEALRQGHDVRLWHDLSHPTTGMKAADFPAMAEVPTFLHGRPEVVGYHGRAGLAERFQRDAPDAVISLRPPAAVLPRGDAPPWVSIQRNQDLYIQNTARALASSSAIAACTTWWVDWGLQYYRTRGDTTPDDATERALRSRSRAVGVAETDATARLDPETIRRRWGVPSDRPVVLLLPFPAGTSGAFWSTSLYPEARRWKQLARVARHGRLEYLPHVLRGWNDARLVRALRAFCDRNGAFLLAKSRRKNPFPAHIQAAADLCIYDESFYPATILEALAISDLCVSFFSTAVTEAAAAGVPHLCISFETHDYYDGDAEAIRSSALPSLRGPGGLFDFDGVTWSWTIPQAIRDLPKARLEDFTLRPAVRDTYLARFVGPEDGGAARRTLDLARAVPTQVAPP